MSKDKEMSFLGHLEELRWRLVKSVAAILVIAVVIFIYRKPIVDEVFMSMKETSFPTYQFFCWISHEMNIGDGLCAVKIDIATQSISPTGQFSTSMYFAFIGGFILMFPFVFYQLWGFIKPALKDSEYKVARGSVFWASFLFLLGVGFGYYLVSPLTVQFFGTFNVSDGVSNNFTINSYLSLITTTTLFSGLFFELPMVIMILSKLGIVSAEFLRKYRKHALVIILIISAVITPPDVISQILVAIPVLGLYEIGILVAKRIEVQKK
ncbi:MAG: twin-arginine translocase subunit TatC [Flavobacteriales bacterium]|nr:twin-arginine translocase subunit TatC [Flavobacteriales bacterium]